MLFSACVAAGLLPAAAGAHEGHDDATPAAPSLAGTDVARVEAQSDLFEIVGVVKDGVLTLYLDRFATNEPVVDAKIDVEAGSAKGAAQANPDGTYSFRHASLSQPGQFPVTLTIVAGADSDLLTGDLVIVDPDAAKSHATASFNRRWPWAVVGALLLAVAAVAWRLRRQRAQRGAR